jgi:WD40 repeat protein
VTLAVFVCLIHSWGRAATAVEPPVTALTFSPDGMAVVAGSQAGVIVFSWPQLQKSRTLSAPGPHVHDLEFSPDGTMLAIAGGAPAESGGLELLSWPEGRQLKRNASHDDVVHAVAWSSDSALIATAAHDHTVQVYDSRDGTVIRRFEGHSAGVRAIAFLPGNRQLVSAGIDQSLRIWDAEDGRCVRALGNHTQPIHDIALRPARAGSLPMLVSVSDDRSVRLWQPTIGRMMRFVRLQHAVPLAVAWTPDGQSIVASCADGRIRIVDPDTVEILDDLPGIEGRANSIAVHPRGDALVVGGGDGQLQRVALATVAQ